MDDEDGRRQINERRGGSLASISMDGGGGVAIGGACRCSLAGINIIANCQCHACSMELVHARSTTASSSSSFDPASAPSISLNASTAAILS